MSKSINLLLTSLYYWARKGYMDRVWVRLKKAQTHFRVSILLVYTQAQWGWAGLGRGIPSPINKPKPVVSQAAN